MINLTDEEWVKCMANTTQNSKKRTRFKTYFDDLLSEKMQQKGFNCILRSKYNWFLKWAGKFICRSEDCKSVYEAKIVELKKGSSVDIEIKCFGECNHPKLNISYRCSGEERRTIVDQVMIYGVEQVMEDLELSKFSSSGN